MAARTRSEAATVRSPAGGRRPAAGPPAPPTRRRNSERERQRSSWHAPRARRRFSPRTSRSGSGVMRASDRQGFPEGFPRPVEARFHRLLGVAQLPGDVGNAAVVEVALREKAGVVGADPLQRTPDGRPKFSRPQDLVGEELGVETFQSPDDGVRLLPPGFFAPVL